MSKVDKALINTVSSMQYMARFIPWVMGIAIVYQLVVGFGSFAQEWSKEHPLRPYLKAEEALILKKFSFPDVCMDRWKGFEDSKERCDKAWKRQAEELQQYGLKVDVAQLSDPIFWEMRNSVISKADAATLKASTTMQPWWDDKRKKAAVDGEMLRQEQLTRLKAFEARKDQVEGK